MKKFFYKWLIILGVILSGFAFVTWVLLATGILYYLVFLAPIVCIAAAVYVFWHSRGQKIEGEDEEAISTWLHGTVLIGDERIPIEELPEELRKEIESPAQTNQPTEEIPMALIDGSDD